MKRDAYNPPILAPAVRTTLAALRWRIRGYLWLEAAATVVAALAIAFWVSLALDWFFEPPPLVRGLIVAAAGIAGAVALVRLVARCAGVPLADRNVANVLERRFPQFNDSLLTAVVLSGRRPDEAGFSPDMLAHSCGEAARRIEGVDLASVFNPAPLRRSLAVAVLLAAAIVGFARVESESLGIWARRTLAFSRELWPRYTQLTVMGFDRGSVKVASGADLEVVARADALKHRVPDHVQVRYHGDDGTYGSPAMDAVGAKATASGPTRNFRTPSTACWCRRDSTWSAAMMRSAICGSRSSRARP